MKKLLLGLLLFTSATSATSAFAATSPNEVAQPQQQLEVSVDHADCINHNEHDEKMVDRSVSSALISMFIKFTYQSAYHGMHTVQNWMDRDWNSYVRYVTAFNEGRHCYNMCPKHININPYDYGFKNSYLCHQ